MSDVAARKFFKGEDYEFPDDSLLERSAEQLRLVIQQHLASALYKVDGLEGMTPVRVDYAQDRIEQARDLLLDLGEPFSRAEIEQLSFLRWPLSDVEKTEQELLRAREAEQFEQLHQHRQTVKRNAIAVAVESFHGRLAENSPEALEISLVIGRSGHSFSGGVITTTGPSGIDVQALVEQLHSLGAYTARIQSYSCSVAGVTFETDPIPSWSVSLDLPAHTRIWDFLMQWYKQHAIYSAPHIEIQWQHQGEHQCDWATFHGVWPDLFNTTDWAALIDELSAFAPLNAPITVADLDAPISAQPHRRRGVVRFVCEVAGSFFRRIR